MIRVWLTLFSVYIFTYIYLQKSFIYELQSDNVDNNCDNLKDDQLTVLSGLSDVANLEQIFDKFCVVRVVGTDKHKEVKNFTIKSMQDLGWTVETDKFRAQTPIGRKTFENVIATLNPNAAKYMVLACHYDSKRELNIEFVGAVDSAMPCSQMINLATVMQKYLEPLKTANLSLMFIFFDGEEAFKKWGPSDSIYGARNLVKKWHSTQRSINNFQMTDLQRVELLVLLDLIGDTQPVFCNYFEWVEKSSNSYKCLQNIETMVSSLRLLEDHNIPYFKNCTQDYYIEDDHIPFLEKDVPVLHLIPSNFPSFWHTENDNKQNINFKTTENINKILRIFVAKYFSLNINSKV